jgi:hypothetical protein
MDSIQTIGLAMLLIWVLGLVVFVMETVTRKKDKAGHIKFEFDDHELPTYDRGHCDRYSAGNFYW